MPRIVDLQNALHAKPVDGAWHLRRRGENNICPIGFHYLQPFFLFEAVVTRGEQNCCYYCIEQSFVLVNSNKCRQ